MGPREESDSDSRLVKRWNPRLWLNKVLIWQGKVDVEGAGFELESGIIMLVVIKW